MHSGHRERMKKRFWRDTLEDHELLELLLFYAIPRVNTNEIAHALLARFGSLSGVLNAGVKELQTVEGIGESAAQFLKVLAELHARCERQACVESELLSSFSELSRYLISLFIGSADEKVFLLLFNSSRRLICCQKHCDGIGTESAVSIRHIMEEALQTGASFAVLAHNHPDGIVFASDEDVIASKKIEKALAGIGVHFIDHYIVTPGSCIPILHPRNSGRD